MIYVAIDTETTGFENAVGSTITQISAVAVDDDSGKFLSTGMLRVKLTTEEIQYFSKEAMEIQKWTQAYNDSGKPLAECVQEFKGWLEQINPAGYIAHVARFDAAFCRRLGFTDNVKPWQCTHQGMKIAEDRRLAKFPNHKLKTLAECCGYKFTQQHSAGDDVLACANGWLWLRRLGLSATDMLYNFCRRS